MNSNSFSNKLTSAPPTAALAQRKTLYSRKPEYNNRKAIDLY